MATIDASVGTSTANSYLTELEANAYFSGHINSTFWDNATNRKALMIHSTRLLDHYMDWNGSRVNDEELQSLEWPRNDVLGVSNSIVPTRIKDAVCELANYVAEKGTSFDLAQASKIKVGPITIDLDSSGSGYLLPPQISRMLNSLGNPKSLPKNGISTVGIVR